MSHVVIVGAGPAGLAAARELKRRGFTPRILERGDAPAWSWRNFYDSLVLHTGRHMSVLPGMRYPRGTPLFPSRNDFVDYLERYVEQFGLRVETGTSVLRAHPPSDDGAWRLETNRGDIEADALVFATGVVANPIVPDIPGRETFAGRVLHSLEYRNPEPFRGRRVLVVGVGNSGGEIASELARAGVDVCVSVRSGADIVPLTIGGIPIQYVATVLWKLPTAVRERIIARVRRRTEKRRGPSRIPPLGWTRPDRIPLIGFHLDDEVRAGRVRLLPAIASITPAGARFDDGSEHPFDDVILATGFRPALQPLEGVVRTDERGFAIRSDRVTSADQPRLFFVGHNYDVSGGLRNIWRDAPLAARAVRRALDSAASATATPRGA